jgi:hypothetical protein
MLTFNELSILLSAAVMLHVTEEFLFPGGFAEWYRSFVPPKKKQGAQTGYLVWINTLLMAMCTLFMYFGETARGMSVWYYVAAACAANGCFHIWGVIKLKKYSPGVITGVLLYIPVFIIGSIQFVQDQSLPVSKIVIGIVAAIGYHVISVVRQRR